MSSIKCPHCGGTLKIEVQPELPLGPIETLRKNKLDDKTLESVKSTTTPNRSLIEAFSLIDSTTTILGEHEMTLNGDLWSAYARICPDALRYAILKWNSLDATQQAAIKHRPGWLTALFKRAQQAFLKESKSRKTQA